MKKSILMTLMTTLCLAAHADTEDLPRSWHTLPEEDTGIRYDQMEEPGQKAAENIERIISSTHDALDRMDTQMRDRSYAKEKKWYLAACVFDLTLSASGTMGFLVAKGDATAALYFRKKQPQNYLRVESEDAVTGDAVFATADTESEIEEKLEPVIRAALATSEIENEEAFRKNLRRVIFDYHDVMGYLAIIPDGHWQLSRLRLDFSVDVSGKVDPVTTIGGGVRLRFEWEPVSQRYTNKAVSRGNYKLGDNLKKLLESLSQELNQMDYQGVTQSGFDLKQVRFAIGLFAEGSFGVVKVGGSVFGHVYYTRRADGPGSAVQWSESNRIPLIDPSDSGRQWALSHGMRNAGGLYSVPGSAFRKGLERAVKITAWMANRRQKAEMEKPRKWELYQLKTEFVLSLSGGMALFKIGGAGGLELVFQKVSQ